MEVAEDTHVNSYDVLERDKTTAKSCCCTQSVVEIVEADVCYNTRNGPQLSSELYPMESCWQISLAVGQQYQVWGFPKGRVCSGFDCLTEPSLHYLSHPYRSTSRTRPCRIPYELTRPICSAC